MRCLLFKITLIFFFLTSFAHARLKYIPIKDMPEIADFVILGAVVDKTARWDDRGVMIYTDYTIQVEENIMGDSPPVIVMSFSGGTVGDKTILVTETPVLEIGGMYILFSYDSGKYSVPTVGHEQGVFRIAYDRVEKKDFVVDYNWYQIEITDNQDIIRGRLAEFDARGALIFRNTALENKRPPLPKPVVRDAKGREILQDSSVFAKPKVRIRGTRATKAEFIDYIRKRIRD